jgi:hypothetical protein
MTGIFSISGSMCRSGWSRLTLIFAALVVSCLINAQEKGIELHDLARQRLAERGEVIIRFIRPADRGLDYFTSFLSIDRVCCDSVTAYANEKGFLKFLDEKIPYEIIQPPSLRKSAWYPYRSAKDWHEHYPSYSSYLALMDSFSVTFPGLCNLEEIGSSNKNHKLLVLKISNAPGIHKTKPVVLLSSTIHGDEPLGYYLLLRLIEELLVHYESDDQIRQLVDSVEIWINPLANPDGTYFISDNSVFGSTRFNSKSVDLNRNFPDPVEGDHPDSYDWQIETLAMMNFMKSIPLVLSANFHGGNEVVNYPWDAFIQLHPDDAWYRKISRSYADTAQFYGPPGYMNALDNGITNGYQWYPVHGGRQDYVNYFLHGREVTIELSYDKIPDETSLNDYWNYNRRSFLQYIGQALTGITGKVTDSVSGLPLKAMVSIQEHDRNNSQVFSDSATGIFYRLAGMGSYAFEIKAEGYTVRKIQAEVTEGRLTRLYVRLSPLPLDLLYPNPFSDLLYFNVDNAGDELVLDFTDLSGRLAKRITQPVIVAGKQEIRVTALASGIYIVSVSYRNKVTRQVVFRRGY